MFTCKICTEEKPTSSSFRLLMCNHSYCSNCIVSYVVIKLDSRVAAINCPEIGCAGVLKPHHCQSILPKQVFDRWCDAQRRMSEQIQRFNGDASCNDDVKLLNLARLKKWMRCPNCRFFVEKSGGCLSIKCRCGDTFCYNCGASMVMDHYCTSCKH
ncbi:E3 ubiquitin-protein ligase RSL1-like [Andrographis paniculata]|uniref:E3 ubiquitin-protein ligase RSL1-like n=1 Tax=Andrographis paniculata TaxID=175694 RepID=UPI0021E72F54|nr:E3 ubiquitin-protein ligase RSL1-like [Andrographis paniculata]